MTIKTKLENLFGRRTFIAAAMSAGALTLAACGGGTGPAETTESATTETAPIVIPMEGLEKTDLKFGFIKLTDMAPLAIAYEKGYFEEEGLFVTLEPQANWKVLLDRVIDGELDGAHMLAGQPLAATIGFGTEAHIVTPFSSAFALAARSGRWWVPLSSKRSRILAF